MKWFLTSCAVVVVGFAAALVAVAFWAPARLVTTPEAPTNAEIREASAAVNEHGVPASFEVAEEFRLAQESAYARDVSDTRRTALAAAAGLVGLVLAGLTWWRTNTMQGQLDVARTSQVTDTFAKAIEQLANRNEAGGTGLEIRLGGIYTLERIARESESERSTVAEVLGAFVRAHAGPVDEEQAPIVQPTDVQAALTVIGRFPPLEDGVRFDLTGADLTGADLTGARLRDATLFGAKLNDADLTDADLTGADLRSTYFRRAKLARTDLTGCELGGAFLVGAKLPGAKLIAADLGGANFEGLDLTTVDFTGADLTYTQFLAADLTGAKLGGAKVDEMYYDERTKWGDFDPPPAA